MRGIRIFVAIFVVMFVALMVFNMPRVEQNSAFPTFASRPTSRPTWTTIITTPTTAVPPTSCPTSATTTQATTTQPTTTSTTKPTTQPTIDSNQVIVNGYVLYPNDDTPIWYNKDYVLGYTNEPVKMTSENRLWLARLLQSEVGGSREIASDQCAIFTCSAMVNRYLASDSKDMLQIAIEKHQFDGVAAMGKDFYNYTPNERTFAIVDYVLKGHRVPKIRFFCTQQYHTWGKGGSVPNSREVVQVGPHYFSEYYNRGA